MLAAQEVDLGGGVEESKSFPPDAFGPARDVGSDDSDGDEEGEADASFPVHITDSFDVRTMAWCKPAMGLPGPKFAATPNASLLMVMQKDIEASLAAEAASASATDAGLEGITAAMGGFALQDTDGRAAQRHTAEEVAAETELARSEHAVAQTLAAETGHAMAPFLDPSPLPGTTTVVVPPSVSFALRRQSLGAFLVGRGRTAALPPGATVDTLLNETFKDVMVDCAGAKGTVRPEWMKDRYFTMKWTTVGVTASSCLFVMTNAVQFVALPVQAVVAAVLGAPGEVDGTAIAAAAMPLAFTLPAFHRVGHADVVVHDEFMTVTTPEGSVYSVDIRAACLPALSPMPDPYASPHAVYCPGLHEVVHVMPSVDYRHPPEPVVAVIDPPAGAPPGAPRIPVFYMWVPTPVGSMAAATAAELESTSDTTWTATCLQREALLHAAAVREAPAGMFAPRDDAPRDRPLGPFDFKVGGLAMPVVPADGSPNTPQGVVAQTWGRPPQACVPLHAVYMGNEDDTAGFTKHFATPPDHDHGCPLVQTAESAKVVKPGAAPGAASTVHHTLVVVLHNNTVVAANPHTMTITHVPITEASAKDTVKVVSFVKSVLFTAGTEALCLSIPGTLPGSVEDRPPAPADLLPPPWFAHSAAGGGDPPRPDGPRFGSAADRPPTPAPPAEDADDADDRLRTVAEEDDLCVDAELAEPAAPGMNKKRSGRRLDRDLDRAGGEEKEAVRSRREAVTVAELQAAMGRAPWGTITGVRETRCVPARRLNASVCAPGSAANVMEGMGTDLETVLGLECLHAKAGAKSYVMVAAVTTDNVKVYMVCEGVEATAHLQLKGVTAVAWQQDGPRLLLHARGVTNQVSTFQVRPHPDKGGKLAIAMDYVNLWVSINTPALATVRETNTLAVFGNGNVASWSRLQGTTTLMVRTAGK